ncbi:hypothetical protein [Streptomyces sp. 5-10]|uniref:hypothetical protein n=1 Tax=Streptomyces sp. 5-10 TaxID=878925 RepID=UPI00168BAAA3|nr:hypothetical protein [Streptomyces sp. 5-10]MBD3004676.1 hypothetical protein [Streptomyces sp. 5-10]
MIKNSAGWGKVSRAEADEMVADVIREAIEHVTTVVTVQTRSEEYGKTRSVEALAEMIPERQRTATELRG